MKEKNFTHTYFDFIITQTLPGTRPVAVRDLYKFTLFLFLAWNARREVYDKNMKGILQLLTVSKPYFDTMKIVIENC